MQGKNPAIVLGEGSIKQIRTLLKLIACQVVKKWTQVNRTPRTPETFTKTLMKSRHVNEELGPILPLLSDVYLFALILAGKVTA